MSLNRARQGEMGYKPLAWSEIHAYMDCTQFKPQAWQYEAIERLDDLFLRTVSVEPKIGTSKA